MRAAAVALLIALLPAALRAQASGPPSAVGVPSDVSGRVVKPGDSSMVAVPNAWVTLHRVGSDRAGPLDSVRTKADGSYRFQYTPSGNADAVYFVSAMFDGIAYFSSPLTTRSVSGEDAEIAVFDTTSRNPKLRVRGRHLVIAAPGSEGQRMVVEVFELSNDTTLTFVASGSRPVWTTALPRGFGNFSVGQSDVAAEAVLARKDRAELFAPFSPGVKQLSFTYALPKDAFPLEVRLPGPADVVEVLVEEPGATVSGDGVADQGPVQVQGRTFHRFFAQNLNDAMLRVAIPVSDTGSWPRAMTIPIGVVSAAMLASLAWFASRKRRPAAIPVRSGERERLARAIAELDEAMETRERPTDEERVAYTEQRAALAAQLATTLAREGGRS